jgi:hypothetical protein
VKSYLEGGEFGRESFIGWNICPPHTHPPQHHTQHIREKLDGRGNGTVYTVNRISYAIKSQQRLHYSFNINLTHGHYLMFFFFVKLWCSPSRNCFRNPRLLSQCLIKLRAVNSCGEGGSTARRMFWMVETLCYKLEKSRVRVPTRQYGIFIISQPCRPPWPVTKIAFI